MRILVTLGKKRIWRTVRSKDHRDEVEEGLQWHVGNEVEEGLQGHVGETQVARFL